jgi:hypothetical protein
MFCTYVIRSTKTGRRYLGSCKNVEERLDRHNSGHSKASKQDAAEMSLTSFVGSAVAAATGPGFKSRRPRFLPLPLLRRPGSQEGVD